MNDENEKFVEVPNTSEDASDFGPLKNYDASTIAISGTDWTVETILLQLKKGNIDLNPRFQRRDAWDDIVGGAN